MRPEDELGAGEFDIAKAEEAAVADGVDGTASVGIVGNGAVMAVDEDGGVERQGGAHGFSLVAADADGDESFPGAAASRTFLAEFLEHAASDLDDVEDKVGGDERVVDGGGIGDEGNGVVAQPGRVAQVGGGWAEEIGDGKPLGEEDFIESVQAQHALAVEEVGDMSGNEAGLPGEH